MRRSIVPESVEKPYLAGKVEDVMVREPLTVRENETIRYLVDLFLEHHFHGVPVLDEGGRLVGLVRDIEVTAMFVTREPFVERYRHVRDIMHVPPFTIRPGETLQAAARKMFADGTRILAVVDEAGAVTGIVTRIDLIKGIRWATEG